MPQPEQNGGNDQRDLEALDEVTLELFTVEPQALAPFESAALRWRVNVPLKVGADVSIWLNGAEVGESGEQRVAPEQTAVYRLSARAGRAGKQLGQVTLDVNLSACVTRQDTQVVKWVAGAIAEKIHERTDGVYLQAGNGSANPAVTITDGQMNLHLVLGKSINNFPDPTITIDASFGLDVVPGPPPVVVLPTPWTMIPPVLAPVNKDIHTDVSFPWYAWLVPGAMIGLPIAISGAEADAYHAADSMIDDIVADLLNGFFAAPPHMYKQSVALFVDSFGGEFGVRFCPAPRPVFE